MTLLAITPVQGIELTDATNLDLGGAVLTRGSKAVTDEFLSTLEGVLNDMEYYRSEPVEKQAIIGKFEQEMRELEGKTILCIRENRTPREMEAERKGILDQSEDSLALLRVALFIGGFWKQAGARPRNRLTIAATPVSERVDIRYISPEGGALQGAWTSVPLQLYGRRLERLRPILDRVIAASGKRRVKRAYRLLSDALEATRIEHFLVWSTSALETLLLPDVLGEQGFNVRFRILCITGSRSDFRITKELYRFRNSFVHDGDRGSVSLDDLMIGVDGVMRRAFEWSLRGDEPSELVDNCLDRVAE
jgi:hypothetical protein